MSILNVRLTRRAALRSLALAGAVVAIPAVRRVGRVAAQEADPSFSDQILPTLGLPELSFTVSQQGIEGVPTSIPAGTYLVNWQATDVIGYLLFAQAPAGLTEDQLREQARAAGSNDQQQAGWVYGGGSNADPGTTVQVVVTLEAGDWLVASSHMVPGGNWETDEIYEITPLTVTEATPTAATPVADLPADISVEIPGLAFVLDKDTVGTGPKLWKFTNTGEQAHHVVITRTPKKVTSADIDQMLNGMMSGTPPAGDEWYTQSVWVGYTALFSPGKTVYNEFDFAPGEYLLACYIADIETGMPHLMMGMWAPFTVEA